MAKFTHNSDGNKFGAANRWLVSNRSDDLHGCVLSTHINNVDLYNAVCRRRHLLERLAVVAGENEISSPNFSGNMQLHSMHSVLHRMGRRATQPGSTQRLRAVLSKRPEQPHNGLSACRSSEMLTGHHDSRRKNQLLNQSNSKMVPLLFKLFYSVNFTASNFYKTKKSKRRTRL